MRTAGGRGIAIGIPAHDEAVRIDRALAAVLAAARGPVPVVLVVAADSCRDETAAVARRRLDRAPANVVTEIVELEAGRVGVAREWACRVADQRLRNLVGEHASRWIATTDADSAVPADWLSTHLRWADRGADAVAGLVRVDPTDPLQVAVRAHLDRERANARVGHHHVFGANLGVDAAWWSRVGGFPPLPVGEDVAFIDRLRAAGARVVGAPDSVVLTSGRLDPRAPGGFGSKLAALTRATGELSHRGLPGGGPGTSEPLVRAGSARRQG